MLNLFAHINKKKCIVNKNNAALMFPDFLIIGAVKAGTSACSYNLGKHPAIFIATIKDKERCCAFRKDNDEYFQNNEIRYFCEKKLYDIGPEWYSCFFNDTKCKIKGEKTPQYLYNKECYELFNNLTCQRIKQLLPDVKIIVLLRDPVNRAFSHWNHIQDQLLESTSKFHHKSFFDCLILEEDKNELLEYGNYYKNLVEYFSVFEKRQIHIAIQERVFNNMHDEYTKMFDFLGVKRRRNIKFSVIHKRDYKGRALDAKSINFLKDYYREDVLHLRKFLGDDLPEWNDY